jgi:putative flippase GtrA
MNLQTFRYAVVGCSNALLGFATYFICFEYILKHRELDLNFYVFKPHSAALFISFFITFPYGFFMSKYVVFSDSSMKARVQLFRYFMICLFNLLLNFILLKILVEQMHVYPVLAQILTTCVVISFSYLAQRHFSFKASPGENGTIN